MIYKILSNIYIIPPIYNLFLLFLIPYFYLNKNSICLNIFSIFGYITFIGEIICLLFLNYKTTQINSFEMISSDIGIMLILAYLCKLISLILIIISVIEFAIFKFFKMKTIFNSHIIIYSVGIILFIISMFIFGY